MGDISTTDYKATLQSLCDQLAALQKTVSTLQQTQPHPRQVEPPRARLLVLPDELIKAVPSMAGKSFFTTPEAEDEDPIFVDDVVFPKNQDQQYRAPSLDLPWPAKAKSYQSFDKSLAKIQERLAFTTRPVDGFATHVFANVSDPALRLFIFDFVQVIRSQLAVTARQITKMRKDNFVVAKGLKPTPDKGKGVTITQEDLMTHIKAAKEYENPCAAAKDSSQGDSRGRGRNRNGFRDSSFNRQSNSTSLNNSKVSTNRRILLRYNNNLLTPARVAPTTTDQDTRRKRISSGATAEGDSDGFRISSRRPFAALSARMARTHGRYMDPHYNWRRLSDSLHESSANNLRQSDRLQGGTANHRARDLASTRKESYRARFGSWFPKPALHHLQEDRGSQIGPQSDAPQLACGTGVVQDGDSEDSMFLAPKEGLSDVCGLEGRIIARVDRPCSPQVSPVCLAGRDVPVQDAPIRALTVVLDLHQNSPPNTAMGEETQDSTLSVPGRSLDHGEFERKVGSGHTSGDGQAAVPGLPGQHGEVTAGAIADSGPPGLHL